MKQKPYSCNMARIRGHFRNPDYRAARVKGGLQSAFLSLLLLLFSGMFNRVTAQVACDPGESAVTLYTSYGVNYAQNAYVTDAQNVIGYPDDNYALLDASLLSMYAGVIDIKLSDVVPLGDTIWFRTASDVALQESNYRVSSSYNGVSFAYAVDYTAPTPGQVLREDFYVVTNPVGVQYLRFATTDLYDPLRLESVTYTRQECYTYCGFETIDYVSGTPAAIVATSTAQDTANAMGLPDGNAASLNGNNDQYLILDLGDTIPYGSYIQLYMARDTASVPSG